jgi:transmembrane sensor
MNRASVENAERLAAYHNENKPLSAKIKRVDKIVVITPELKQRTVSGDFEIDRLDTFVVQQLFGAHATSPPGGLVILS